MKIEFISQSRNIIGEGQAKRKLMIFFFPKKGKCVLGPGAVAALISKWKGKKESWTRNPQPSTLSSLNSLNPPKMKKDEDGGERKKTACARRKNQ